MKIAIAVLADFSSSLLGGPEVLSAPLAGGTMLGHTLRRAAQIEGADVRCLVCPPRDEQPARAALAASVAADRFELIVTDDTPRPRRSLIQSARKWNLDAWRGSPLGTTWFDEYVDVRAAVTLSDATRGWPNERTKS